MGFFFASASDAAIAVFDVGFLFFFFFFSSAPCICVGSVSAPPAEMLVADEAAALNPEVLPPPDADGIMLLCAAMRLAELSQAAGSFGGHHAGNLS